MAAGGLGVAFQVLVSHRLPPGDYGGVFAVVTLITLIGLPASAFTLLMSRATSRDRAVGQYAPSAALLRGGNNALILCGLAVAGVLALSAPMLAAYLSVPSGLIFAGAVGIPFAFGLPLLIGEFQGEQRFFAFATLLAGQALLKLMGALALGSLLGPVGIIGGISLGTAAVYLVALLVLRHKLSIESTLQWWRPAAAYLAVIVPSTLALAVLLSADVLIVKHYFPTREAGEYAAVAALGRAIFWGATGVAGVLFPKIVFRESQRLSGSSLVSASLLLVIAGGLVGSAVLSLGSTTLLTAFAGTAYRDAAVYLPWYGLGMTLLGGAAVLIAVQQSRGKPAFLAMLVPLTLLEPVLLIAFHQNLMQVVQVVDVSMAVVLGGLTVQFVIQLRAASADFDTSMATNGARARAIPQVSVNQ
jgi:O-antigen/teichoic acid export membrane protein